MTNKRTNGYKDYLKAAKARRQEIINRLREEYRKFNRIGTQERVAREYGVSVQRINQIWKKYGPKAAQKDRRGKTTAKQRRT